MKVLGMALMPFVALAAKALPDGQQYFGRIRDNTPIVTNGYTRMQIDARACHVLESANTYTDAATNAAHKSAVGMVSAARGYADGATNAVAKTLRDEIDAIYKAGFASTADLAKVATSGVYADLTGKPTIPTVPTKVSAFANDSGYVTKAVTNGLASAASVASATEKADAAASAVSAHTASKANPHGVTAAQVGAYTKAQADANVAAATNGLASSASVDGLAAEVAGKANAASVYTKTQADARYYPADEGALWSSWWSGDGFRVVVSNYDVNVLSAALDRLPAAAFEYRPGGTGDLVRVWDERTRWARHRIEFADFQDAMDAALAEKSGLDWGKTTPTGFDAPDGFTWLDTPAVAIAGGLAWQKTVTSEGAVWLLCSNGMVAELGSSAASTNGYFKITDERGETAFEIVQGDRRTVGANPASLFTWAAADGKTHLRVVYNIVSDAAPTLYVADALKLGGGTTWKAEGADGCPAQFAGWTGSSGAWTNALWRTTTPAADESDALFCYATYEEGGETVVKNHAPVALSKLVLGGVTYTVGTAEISGHTVLTLTPQGGN